MRSKVNLTFSKVSAWIRNLWKTRENASVDGEFSNKNSVFKCMLINVGVVLDDALLEKLIS